MAQLRENECIGIVGTGQMGRGIAQVCMMADLKVILFDESLPACTQAVDFIENQLKKGVEKNKWTAEKAANALGNCHKAQTIQDLASCSVIIEAISENLNHKSQLFQKLDQICPESTIFCSNTSSISITQLASQTKRPDRFIGMHFMNPVPVMKLIEGITGLETSEQTLATIKELGHKLGKTFVQVRDIPGFAVNRILMPMINEAIFALYEGIASIQDIDTAMKLGTNVPMGPLQLADFIGLDTCLSIMEVLYDGLGDSKYRPCPLLKQYVHAKKLGVKTKRGFYDY